MNNAELLEALPDRDQRRADLADLDRTIEQLTRELAELRAKQHALRGDILVLDTVTEVADGVALRVEEFRRGDFHQVTIESVGFDLTRDAELVENVARPGRWALTLHDSLSRRAGEFPGKGGAEMGNQWSYDDALTAARNWVLHSTVCEKTETVLG